MLYNGDHRIRAHRLRGDSGQNEAERTNAAIEHSVVDGGTIQWKNHKRFEDLTEEQIGEIISKSMSNMRREEWKNACRVKRELVKRIGAWGSAYINKVAEFFDNHCHWGALHEVS